ncbi:MAG: aminotransferase class IV [Sneathiella sp.]
MLLDSNGNIAEGPGFNIFAVKDNYISTPASGVLHGITRQTIFDICKILNLDCQKQDISVETLMVSDEVFVTSTAGGVMPVSRINDQAIGRGKVGPLTEQIKKYYWELHKDKRHCLPVEYPG